MWKRVVTWYKKGAAKEFVEEMKWVLSFSLRYWRAVLYYIALGVLGTVMGLVSTVASKQLIDVVTGQEKAKIVYIALAIAGLTIGGIVTNMITKWINIRIGLKVNREIQEDIYEEIMNTDWQELSGYHSGDILNRFTTDVGTVADSVLEWIPSLLVQLFEFFGTLGIILYYDASMAVIALMSAPVTLMLSKFMTRRMRNFNKKMRVIYSDKMLFEQESFHNMQQIKAFNLIPLFKRRFSDIQEKYIKATLEYNHVSIYISAFLALIGTVVSYSCFGWGVYRLWSGAITYGTMMMFLQLAESLSGGFSSMVSMIPSAIEVTTAAGRILEVIHLPREDEGARAEIAAAAPKAEQEGLKVVFHDVSFHYKTGEYVLEHVNLIAAPKEIVALVGPSGEGKTTTIRLLLGLVSPQQGECYLMPNGQDKVQIPLSAGTRNFFSYVPQGNTLFSGTIAENMRMVNEHATDQQIIEALEAACAYEFVKQLPDGIHSKIIENGTGFSEGQYQRLCIARAILYEAPILLLDEATSALDVATERKVLRNILKMERMRTCIITTHRPSVLSMCNRVYHIHKTMMEELTEKEVEGLMKDF